MASALITTEYDWDIQRLQLAAVYARWNLAKAIALSDLQIFDLSGVQDGGHECILFTVREFTVRGVRSLQALLSECRTSWPIFLARSRQLGTSSD